MSKVRVASFGMSLDGFSAGVDQDLEHPLGANGEKVFEWFFGTRTFQSTHGATGGAETGVDEEFAQAGFANVGSWILGRNMFGPVRGPWPPDERWRGWWGDDPVYHCPVFVLTHHARPSLEMQGGTTFHFVTDGIESALEQARAAARGMDVRIGGGANTIRQYLQARLLDELHLAVSPVLLGQGESLLAGLDLVALGYEVERSVASEKAMHVVLRKS